MWGPWGLLMSRSLAVRPRPLQGRSRETGNSCDTAGQRGSVDRTYEDRRTRRYGLRNAARRVTALDGLRQCGYAVTGVAECVQVRVGDDERAFVTGVQTCQSVWACPVCSAAIREGRAVEVEAAATQCLRDGGSIAFVTLTAPHSRDDRLSDLLGYLAEAWHDLTGNRMWRSTAGLRGYVKTTEITDGFPNGWHPHVHALVFFDRKVSAAELDGFAEYVRTSWGRSMENRWGRRINGHGVRVQPIRLVAGRADVGEYLAKVQDGMGAARSVGREMTRTDLKRGRRHNRFSPFELLEGATKGDVRAKARWLEYEAATKGRRCLEWSRAEWVKTLRERAALTAEESPDEVQEPSSVVLAELSLAEWALVARYGAQARLLDLAEQKGLEGVLEQLATLRRRDAFELRRLARGTPATTAG